MKSYQPPVRDKVRRVSVEDLIALRNGRPFTASPEITFEAEAWIKVCQHAGDELRREVGGLLLGTVFEADGQLHVVIQDVILAEGTVNTLTSVEFTLATWKQLLEDKAAHHGDKIIAGWYHSHPGFGLFLSSFDQFIHRNFFTRPWHLALVVDPVAQSAAFFLIDQEKLSRRDDFSVRVHGHSMWNTGKHTTAKKATPTSPLPALPVPSKPIGEGNVKPALMLDQFPDADSSIVAAVTSADWLCIATTKNRIVAQSVDGSKFLSFSMPASAEIKALALDDAGTLYILSGLRREIWYIELSRQKKPGRLEIDGYEEWKASLPAGLIVCQGQVLVWDWNRLLFFQPNKEKGRLTFLKQFEKPEILLAQTLRAGNYHQTAIENRLYINEPQQDRIEVITLSQEIESTAILGSKAGLRSAQAITVFQDGLFLLDSEGTRILSITYDGIPRQQYLLDAALRSKDALAILANRDHLYLVARNGIHQVGISAL